MYCDECKDQAHAAIAEMDRCYESVRKQRDDALLQLKCNCPSPCNAPRCLLRELESARLQVQQERDNWIALEKERDAALLQVEHWKENSTNVNAALTKTVEKLAVAELQVDELKALLKEWAYYDGFCTACGDSSMERHRSACPLRPVFVLEGAQKRICEDCKGTGEIGLADGEVPCPKCGQL